MPVLREHGKHSHIISFLPFVLAVLCFAEVVAGFSDSSRPLRKGCRLRARFVVEFVYLMLCMHHPLPISDRKGWRRSGLGFELL